MDSKKNLRLTNLLMRGRLEQLEKSFRYVTAKSSEDIDRISEEVSVIEGPSFNLLPLYV